MVSFLAEIDTGEDVLSDEISLSVDGTPPEIVIDSPAEAFIEDGPVLVQGVASDAQELASITYEGEEVEIDSDGAFAFEGEEVHGMNIVIVEATDLAGNTTRDGISFLFSPEWTPLETKAEPESGALGAQARISLDDLASEVIHGLEASYNLSHEPAAFSWVTEDFTASETYICEPLWRVESPMFEGSVNFQGVEVRSPQPAPELTARPAGFDLEWTGEVTALYGVTTRSHYFHWGGVFGCIPFGPCSCQAQIPDGDGQHALDTFFTTVGAPVSVTVTGGFDVEFVDGVLFTTTANFESSDAQLVVDNDTFGVGDRIGRGHYYFNNSDTPNGVAYQMLQDATFDLHDTFQGPVSTFDELIAPTVESAFVTMDLSGLLSAFDWSASGTIGRASQPAHLASALDDLEFGGDGALTSLRSAVGITPVMEEGAQGPGAIGRADCLGTSAAEPDLSTITDVGFALSLDVFNQLLYASWVGTDWPISVSPQEIGAIEEQLPNNASISAIEIEASAPTVLSDCNGNNLQIQVSSAAVTITYEVAEEIGSMTMNVALTAVLDLFADEVCHVAIVDVEPMVVRVSVDEEMDAAPLVMAEDIAMQVVEEHLAEDLVSSLFQVLMPPRYTLASSGQQATYGPVYPSQGFLTQDPCADAGCTPGEDFCSADGNISSCQQISTSCTWATLHVDCVDEGLICDVVDDAPACM